MKRSEPCAWSAVSSRRTDTGRIAVHSRSTYVARSCAKRVPSLFCHGPRNARGLFDRLPNGSTRPAPISVGRILRLVLLQLREHRLGEIHLQHVGQAESVNEDIRQFLLDG